MNNNSMSNESLNHTEIDKEIFKEIQKSPCLQPFSIFNAPGKTDRAEIERENLVAVPPQLEPNQGTVTNSPKYSNKPPPQENKKIVPISSRVPHKKPARQKPAAVVIAEIKNNPAVSIEPELMSANGDGLTELKQFNTSAIAASATSSISLKSQRVASKSETTSQRPSIEHSQSQPIVKSDSQNSIESGNSGTSLKAIPVSLRKAQPKTTPDSSIESVSENPKTSSQAIPVSLRTAHAKTTADLAFVDSTSDLSKAHSQTSLGAVHVSLRTAQPKASPDQGSIEATSHSSIESSSTTSSTQGSRVAYSVRKPLPSNRLSANFSDIMKTSKSNLKPVLDIQNLVEAYEMKVIAQKNGDIAASSTSVSSENSLAHSKSGIRKGGRSAGSREDNMEGNQEGSVASLGSDNSQPKAYKSNRVAMARKLPEQQETQLGDEKSPGKSEGSIASHGSESSAGSPSKGVSKAYKSSRVAVASEKHHAEKESLPGSISQPKLEDPSPVNPEGSIYSQESDHSQSSNTSSSKVKSSKAYKSNRVAVSASVAEKLSEEQESPNDDSKPLQSGTIQRQYYFGITAPSETTTEGPWTDTLEPSPILQRKFEFGTVGSFKVHLVTIGRPSGDKDFTRRIKIYEHDILRNEGDLDLICKQLSETPEKALVLVDDLLRNPKSPRKMVDKVLTKANAIKAVVGAQQSLSHIFGSWLNPQLVSEEAVASSEVIYLVDFCPEHGAIARPLKNLPSLASRKQVKGAIADLVPVAVDSAWEHHPNSGFSLAIVVPIGKSSSGYHC